MNSFGLGIFVGCFGFFGAIGAVYAGIAHFRPDSFPAPPITRLAALDEKLRFIRENPQIDPKLLAIGSSIAWRQVAGDVYAKTVQKPTEFLNGGTVHLQIHQTADLLDFYLEHYRNVQQVIILTSLPDYDNCSAAPAAMFDHADAANYAFADWPSGFFYMRYFSPQRFLGSVLSLAKRTQPMTGDLYIDEFGSGPIQVPVKLRRGLRYGDINVDPACVEALRDLIRSATARGLELTIVYPPVHPDYLRQYPEAAARLEAIIAGATQEVDQAKSATVVDMHRYTGFAETDYFDAFHLDYSAVARLSGKIVAQLSDVSSAGDRADQES